MPENYLKEYPLFNEFTITYVGSIYPTQPIELFLEGIKSYIDLQETPPKLKVIFIGIKDEPPIINRINNNIVGFENYFEFTSRIPKKEAIEIQSRSHMLLVCAHTSLKGVPGSKLYEYVALKKPVLIYPSDKDIIERTLNETGQSLVCETKEDLIGFLTDFNLKKDLNTHIISEKVNEYSRSTLVDILINSLNSL
jgi:glycosyltransferase involved in cell wall biosynthesis